MEMCYDGALVMPKNYAVVNEEEMTYIDGGWSGKKFMNNIKGLAALCASVITICKAFNCWDAIMACAATCYTKALALYSGLCLKLSAVVGSVNLAGGIIVGVSTAAAIFTLGTWSIF